MTLQRLILLKQMQVIQGLSSLLFLISAGCFLGFIQKLRVDLMVMDAEESLIDCTCVRAMPTYIQTHYKADCPQRHISEKSGWLRPHLDPAQFLKIGANFHPLDTRAKINSAVPTTCLIDPSVELASTLPIIFRGLGNLLYTTQGRIVVWRIVKIYDISMNLGLSQYITKGRCNIVIDACLLPGW